MKLSFVFLVFALLGVAAHARDVPAAAPHLESAASTAPLEMQLSEAFLAEASEAVAVGHKLPYSNPSTGACQTSEAKVTITGIPGSFCSPKCGPSLPCPANTHFASSASPQCVLEAPGTPTPSQCALICRPPLGGCPKGASCQPIQGLGICTYASGPQEEDPEAAQALEEVQE